MRLSRREVFLLKLTGLVLLLALSYYFGITPELDKLTAREQLTVKTAEVEAVKVEIAAIPQMKEKVDTLKQSIIQSSMRFLPEIQQKKLIILLDELLRESNATSDSMGFSQLIFVDQALINQDTNSSGGSSDNASEANEGSDMELLELNIQSMSIQAPLFGKYEEIMDFVSRLENLNRTTVINGLQLTKGTDGNVSGTIGLDFYSMNKLTEDPMDESYLEWSYSTPKGIDNPFKFIPLESSEVDEPPVEGTPGEEINEAVPGTP